MSLNDAVPYDLAPQRCAVCADPVRLLHCSSCKVVSYCGTEHQSANRSKHKSACIAIRKSREVLEQEETALRADPGDGLIMPVDVFNTAVGHFWGILGTRDYMRARFAAVTALLRVHTVRAVEKALGHLTDMLRLCRSDNLGVRDIIPYLLLRLGREQECYDFLKWWAVVERDSYYDWGDTTLPYLDIRGADAFEPIDMFSSNRPRLPYIVALTLLKLRLYLDLTQFEDLEFGFGFNNSWAEPDQPVGMLVREKIQSLDLSDVSTVVEALRSQYQRLCQVVNDANPHFWEALVDEGDETPSPPPHYSPGSIEEANLALHICKRAWQETEDAILMVHSDTWRFTRVYEGNGIRNDPAETAEAMEIRRGTGHIIPSKFEPPSPTSYPSELFHSTSAGHNQMIRFVCCSNPKKVLVYVDGACADNGQPEARAGWAVVCGPPNSHEESSSWVACGRLEIKGPFGDVSAVTSNRAELRAVIAALRLCDWLEEGFDSIVIAIDSSYVVDGATGWVRGWVRNGWKTRTGDPVKNQDLWECLLGEVERWKACGLRVELWKIPRELNDDADTAAKRVIHEAADEAEFRDIVTRPLQTTTARTEVADCRVLALCLEEDSLVNAVHGNLISLIASKATMERATTQRATLSMLHQQPPPSIILILDGALTRQRRVWEHVIDHLRHGATVVLAGCFSSLVSPGQLNGFFAKLGLPWEMASYNRTKVNLRSNAVGGHLTNRLPPTYSPKAVFVKNVERSAAWYTSSDNSSETAAAFTKVGNGKLGYIGDVNGEQSSEVVVLAMCGLLD
ncbi:hypothetical protein BP5796_12851 [Coleophoma crateriformis]|uniref:ribonuclease H n=1 Tax=Coleophoma crateriformis TaxID=565419 RepID=A0A3D8Q6F5_9HELO|nr:hypothetical protein BP5796_12851 [Coleophoma crateriformis]